MMIVMMMVTVARRRAFCGVETQRRVVCEKEIEERRAFCGE